MLNKCMIIGRLGKNPEIRTTPSGSKVANFNVAVSEKRKDKQGQVQESTEWCKIVLWGKLSEIAEKYLRKGSLVYIEGKLKTRDWEDKDGVRKYTTEIIGNQLQMLGSKSDNQSSRTDSFAAGAQGYDERNPPTAEEPF